MPTIPRSERLTVEPLSNGFFRLVARYGFMESPDVTVLLAQSVAEEKLRVDPAEVTYFLGRETFIVGSGGRMGKLSEGFFSVLSRNARSASTFFNVPSEQVVEIGTQIDL